MASSMRALMLMPQSNSRYDKASFHRIITIKDRPAAPVAKTWLREVNLSSLKLISSNG